MTGSSMMESAAVAESLLWGSGEVLGISPQGPIYQRPLLTLPVCPVLPALPPVLSGTLAPG